MTTAIDTYVIVALWDADPALGAAAEKGLETAFRRGALVLSAPVFAELLAAPGRSEAFLNRFLDETGVLVDWELDEAVWRVAGRAFQAYSERRRKHGSEPRRILADFLVGAHAEVRGFRLLTLDERLYRAAFPKLTIESI